MPIAEHRWQQWQADAIARRAPYEKRARDAGWAPSEGPYPLWVHPDCPRRAYSDAMSVCLHEWPDEFPSSVWA